MSVITFVAQWTLILQLLWISCVLIPFTLLAIIFFVLNWLILDPFTNFLITGSFNTSIMTSQITWQSPIIIITIIGLILAFIALIVFIINYFAKNSSNLQAIHIPKQLLLIFGFIGLIIVIPFGFILMSVFSKFITSITLTLFTKTQTMQIVDLENLKTVLQNLLAFSTNKQIDLTVWNDAWATITDANQLAIKNELYNSYTALVNAINELNINNLAQELLNNTNNLAKLQELLKANPNLTEELTNLINLANNFKAQLINLNSLSLAPETLNQIKLNLGTLNDLTNIQSFTNNVSDLLKIQVMVVHLNLNSTGEIVQTNNLAFMLYYAATGLYVNSIEGIIGNFTFISGLFQANGIFELAKSIFLSGIIAVGIAKGISTLVSMLIYRWFALLSGIPTGYIAAARITNDTGQILKIWFREILTSTLALFVITLNLQIMYFLINAIQIALLNNSIHIDGISNVNLGIMQVNIIEITFALLIVILVYVNNGFISKTLETFNASVTFKDQAAPAIVSEFSNFKKQARNKNTVSRRTVKRTKEMVPEIKKGFKSTFAKLKFKE